ncbi:MAG: HEAT repeat domain-containing protein [Myxococcales bacterium]|nr:HEAT repeat domain-containing protein [Myxococcales bacterium]
MRYSDSLVPAALPHRTRSGILRRLGLGLAVALGLATTPARAGDEQYPLWPTAVDVAAAPLKSGERAPRLAQESRRLDAIFALVDFPLPLVEEHIIAALADPSPQIRRLALQQCIEREVARCVPEAERIWKEPTTEDSVRVLALRMLSHNPNETRLQLIIDAMQDVREELRAEATALSGGLVVAKPMRERLRTALVAKLADTAPIVRQSAARSLGMRGPGSGALALARLLEDPNPQVRRAAGQALGELGDPRAIPPLTRALEAGDESYVSRTLLLTLATLPGDEVDAFLLRILDEPPRGLSTATVASIIGLRPDPSRALVDALIDRMGEPALRSEVIDTLRTLGEQAKPALVAARQRGLAPQVDAEVSRLLAALDPPDAIDARYQEDRPTPTTPRQWSEALADPDLARALTDAVALAEGQPAWLGEVAVGVLERGDVEEARPWLFALALTTRPLHLPDRARPLLYALLERQARATGLRSADRCLAIMALGTARSERRSQLRHVGDVLEQLTGARAATVRACAALSLTAFPGRSAALTALLHDDVPQARAAASLALLARGERPSAETLALLSLRAESDRHPAVRALAGLARDALARAPRRRRSSTSAIGHGLWDLRSKNSARAWQLATIADVVAPVPLVDVGGVAWTIVPNLSLKASSVVELNVDAPRDAAALLRP